MVRKKEEAASAAGGGGTAKAKSKDSAKSGKDAPKKERLSVSAFLSNIDKPKPAVAPKPKAKAAPAASAYTSGLDLPPSDDEDEVYLPVLLLFSDRKQNSVVVVFDSFSSFVLWFIRACSV
jgi:hypothetical protein